MAYSIRIMYGTPALTKRFRFETEDKENSADKFDKAVKELNQIYKENGRFETIKEVENHFKKYDFYRIEF